MLSNPKLSIVVAVRNDNYGGDFIERLQACVNWNTKFLEKFGVTTEFLMVNWNPVAENVPLYKSIDWPQGRKFVEYRLIDVPPEVHQHYVDPTVRKTVPLFEFIAKNVGIRRASGELVLCINADILIHPEIIEFIGSTVMDKSRYYRANRLDFKIGAALNLDELWSSGFAISLRGFMYRFNSLFDKRKQYKRLQKINALRLKWEAFKLRNSKLVGLFRFPVVYNNGGYQAHCLNAGDFMLMDKANWLRLKGYPEYTAISTHTDAIFTVLANGILEEVVLQQPVFHQEHERRYTWEAIQNSNEFDEAYKLFEDIASSIAKGNSVHQYLNTDGWGLEQYNLNEQVIEIETE